MKPTLETSATAAALVAEAIEHYRARRYFEAHELFEEAWVGSGQPRSLELHALAQLAAGLHKRDTQHALAPALAILGRARAKLERLGSSAFGLDLDALRADLEPARLAACSSVPRLERL